MIVGVTTALNAVVFCVSDERSTLAVTLWPNRVFMHNSISVAILETGLRNINIP